jgi:KEOPS complex subunit Cgi121
LKHIPEYGKHIAIAGFRDAGRRNVKELLKTINTSKPPNVEVQFFDSKLVATWQHLYFAVLNALTSFKNKDSISRSLAMETILYAAAQRQIRKATQLLGIKPSSRDIAVLMIGDSREAVGEALSAMLKSIGAHQDDRILDMSEEKMAIIKEAFKISDLELETVAREKENLKEAVTCLVIERMALLATKH